MPVTKGMRSRRGVHKSHGPRVSHDADESNDATVMDIVHAATANLDTKEALAMTEQDDRNAFREDHERRDAHGTRVMNERKRPRNASEAATRVPKAKIDAAFLAPSSAVAERFRNCLPPQGDRTINYFPNSTSCR